jgi:hypothetical protein
MEKYLFYHTQKAMPETPVLSWFALAKFVGVIPYRPGPRAADCRSTASGGAREVRLVVVVISAISARAAAMALFVVPFRPSAVGPQLALLGDRVGIVDAGAPGQLGLGEPQDFLSVSCGGGDR